MNNIDLEIERLVEWLKVKVDEAGAKGVVFGLSGGVDSAVMAGIAKKAFPESSLGIIMPCHSDPIDEAHGIIVAESVGLKTEKVDLSESFDMLLKSMPIDENSKLATSNLKPRLRMTTLYYFAQNLGYLVLGPTNLAEYTVGYFTKHGDSAVDLMPLANFVKSEIRELARALDIPSEIIDKAPTAGLWEKQSDEDEMGFGYDVLDNYIKTGQGPKDIVEKIEKMNRVSNHKRNYPPIYNR